MPSVPRSPTDESLPLLPLRSKTPCLAPSSSPTSGYPDREPFRATPEITRSSGRPPAGSEIRTKTKGIDRLYLQKAYTTDGDLPLPTHRNHTFLWTPTGRLRDPDENQRNRQTVFAKGVYDRWRLTTTDSSVWTWRRIIFRSHIKYSDGLAYNNTKTYFRNCQIDTAQHQAVLEDLLTGTVNADWVDPMLGKIDRTHITILSDRIRYLRPKGEKGDLHVYDQYIPINRNITYNDEEVLGGDNSQPWASDSRANPGNVYVFDIMKSNNGTGAPLRYACESTYYWHEK
ncbi:MAG: Cap [Gemykroznavirus sp.]|nr:MAG: Cap [Gemykroznavirus sp.]